MQQGFRGLEAANMFNTGPEAPGAFRRTAYGWSKMHSRKDAIQWRRAAS